MSKCTPKITANLVKQAWFVAVGGRDAWMVIREAEPIDKDVQIDVRVTATHDYVTRNFSFISQAEKLTWHECKWRYQRL